MMSQTLQEATSGTTGTGGTNPMQIGLGVTVGAVTPDFTEGALQETGNPLDLAINGNGFLALTTGTGTVFTQSAGFSVDGNGQLVDSQNGYYLLGTDNNPITVPTNVQIPAQQTANLTLAGNLSAGTTLPTAETLSTSNAFETIYGPATGTTPLNDLTDTTTQYQDGDTIVISGTGANGQAITPATFTYGTTGTTMGDLIGTINTAFAGQATASLNSSGNIVLTADQAGASQLSLTIAGGTGSKGVTDWADHPLSVQTAGATAGTYAVSANIYDSLGNSHVLTLTFTPAGNNVWNMSAAVDDPQATLTKSTINGITFNNNGSFEGVTGSGTNAQQLTLNYGTTAAPQTINLSFGTAGGFNGLTLFGGSSTAAATKQDGYTSGTLSSFNIGADGTIQGVYTNGVQRTLGQIQTATFANPQGLQDLGNGVWSATSNSGDAVLGAASAGSTGPIASGTIEGSNVNTAQQLSTLIVAQNNYDLNARAMSVSSQVIQQLTQIIT
jgi:flagellar hook protein FlgE